MVLGRMKAERVLGRMRGSAIRKRRGSQLPRLEMHGSGGSFVGRVMDECGRETSFGYAMTRRAQRGDGGWRVDSQDDGRRLSMLLAMDASKPG